MTKPKSITIVECQTKIQELVRLNNSYEYITELLSDTKTYNLPDLLQHPEALSLFTRDTCLSFSPYKRMEKIRKYGLIAPKNRKHFYIYDEENKEIEIIAKEYIKDFYIKKEHYLNKMKFIDISYNPLIKEYLYNMNGIEYFNNYIPPNWKKDYWYNNVEIELKDELPTIYSDFFDHICNGEKESISFLLDWLSISLQSRNRTYLCAVGEQGVGKGILGEIITELHGSINSVRIKGDSITGRFNKLMAEKTFIFLDEITYIDNKNASFIKNFNNDDMEVEFKGVDSNVEQNYSNIYMASNSIDVLPIETGDRRFSVLNLNTTILNDVYSPNHYFWENYKTKENIMKLAQYLWHRKYDTNNITRAFSSEHKKKIIASRVKDWQEDFISVFCKQNPSKTIALKEITEKLLNDNGGRKTEYSRKVFEELTKKYPGVFVVIKTIPDNASSEDREIKMFCIKIKSLKEQRDHSLKDET